MTKRALIYARTATSNPGGILAQLNECETYAADNGMIVAQRVADNHASGLSLTHPGAIAVSMAVSRAEVDAVLVTRLDRISRSWILLHGFIEKARRLGIDVISIDGEDLRASPGHPILNRNARGALLRKQ